MKRQTLADHARLRADALELMRADVSRQWTVDDVALSLNVSKRTLQRAFKVGDSSFRDELRRFRMITAAEILGRREGWTVKEIANMVGYSQQAQFAKAFTMVFGVTPSRYE